MAQDNPTTLPQLSNSTDRRYKHGWYGTPEYKAWCTMKSRCYCPGNASYERYGGRGISVCPQWRNSFEQFVADMGTKPTLAHSLERIDGENNYEPGNCKWATCVEQANNIRTNRWLTFNGQTMTVAQWSRHLGIEHSVILKRANRGLPVDQVLSTKLKRYLKRKVH